MTYDQEKKFRHILNPLRAEFEKNAQQRPLDLSREREWYMFEGFTEEDRPYYNKSTNAAWWAWRAAYLQYNCVPSYGDIG